jgi:peptidoglycan hydrolase-like amidase
MTRRIISPLTIVGTVLLLLTGTGCGPPSSVTFAGHGYGHGRGMGQWGAYGYAVDHGWSWMQIMNHYYGGTSASTLGTNPMQRVLMQSNAGHDLVVAQQRGHIVTSVGKLTVGAHAVRVHRLDGARFALSESVGCAGPWTLRHMVTAAELTIAPMVRNEDRAEMLQLCRSTGQELVRGSLIAVHSATTIQTVNAIDTENMLRSVIAREMSPSWADAGGGRGIHALQAQAVAARSYMNSGDTRWSPIATTCDGGSCEAYSGVGSRTIGATKWSIYEDPRTDLAVASTARSVRRFSNGKVAATEFSASSGGWSRGPVFTPVVDAGDATTSNPNHNWKVTLRASTIEAAFDRRAGHDLGPLQGIVVEGRDGMGADGGRVTSVRTRFAGAEVVVSGETMRALLGFKSSWFTPSPH